MYRPALVPPSPGRRRAEGLVSACASQRVLTEDGVCHAVFAVSPAEQALLPTFTESRSACELQGSASPRLSVGSCSPPLTWASHWELPGGLPHGLHTEGAAGWGAWVPRPLKSHLGQGWRCGVEHIYARLLLSSSLFTGRVPSVGSFVG